MCYFVMGRLTATNFALNKIFKAKKTLHIAIEMLHFSIFTTVSYLISWMPGSKETVSFEREKPFLSEKAQKRAQTTSRYDDRDNHK